MPGSFFFDFLNENAPESISGGRRFKPLVPIINFKGLANFGSPFFMLFCPCVPYVFPAQTETDFSELPE